MMFHFQPLQKETIVPVKLATDPVAKRIQPTKTLADLILETMKARADAEEALLSSDSN